MVGLLIGLVLLFNTGLAQELPLKPTDLNGIKKELNSLRVEHSDIVLRQYALESGIGTSRLARECNNIFGMKYPTKRPTTAIGKTKSGFAIYVSVREAIIDYLLWQAYYAKGLSRQQYLNVLQRNYGGSNNYLQKLFGIDI